MYDELKAAIAVVLSNCGQSIEYKRRLQKVIENCIEGNLLDADVIDVIDLISVSEELDS